MDVAAANAFLDTLSVCGYPEHSGSKVRIFTHGKLGGCITEYLDTASDDPQKIRHEDVHGLRILSEAAQCQTVLTSSWASSLNGDFLLHAAQSKANSELCHHQKNHDKHPGPN